MDILLLTASPQHAAENPSVELNTKRLKQWIAKLPVMNVIETVKLLQQSIEPFNELQVSDADRLKLLEIYREAFDEILFFYDNARLHQLPIPAAQRKSLSDDIMWLYLGLASGYKTLVRNGFEAEHSPKRDSDLLLATYRAMELIVHALLYAYRAHETPPPLAYLEVNQLYSFAEYHQAQDAKIKAVSRESVAPTIDRLYKQFLMITVADPYKIDGHEIHELYMLLEPFSAHCALSSEMKSEAAAGKFVIDLMEDSAPYFCESVSEMPILPTSRTLDLTPALNAMESRLREMSSDETDFIQDQETRFLTLFTKHFNQRKDRKNERIATNRDVKLALGLTTVSYFLNDTQRLQNTATKNIEIHGGIEVSDVSSEEDADYKLTQWCIIDESESGCLLMGDSHQLEKDAKIGDLLGIVVTENEQASLELGVIRWKRVEESGQLKMGIEFVPGHPMAISCQVKDQNTGEPCDMQALYFPRDVALKRPATLFAATELFEQYKMIQAIVKGKTFTVQPGESLIETPLYCQFRFSAVRE